MYITLQLLYLYQPLAMLLLMLRSVSVVLHLTNDCSLLFIYHKD